MARPRPRIRFRKDRELWEVDWDGEGVRRRPMFQTEEQAHEHASGVLRVQGGLPAAGVYREIRLRDFAAQWLVQIEVDKELATVRGYAASLTGHVIPALGHLRLRELQRAHIKAFLAEKRRSGYARTRCAS